MYYNILHTYIYIYVIVHLYVQLLHITGSSTIASAPTASASLKLIHYPHEKVLPDKMKFIYFILEGGYDGFVISRDRLINYQLNDRSVSHNLYIYNIFGIHIFFTSDSVEYFLYYIDGYEIE